MAENTRTIDASQYEILITISKEIGELKGDIKNTNERLNEIDRTITSRIEEAFDAVTKKQEFLRDSLEAEIGGMRAQAREEIERAKEEIKSAKAEIKQLNERIDAQSARIDALENSGKNKLYELFVKFKGLLIAAILAALVGYCMSFIKDITFLVREPPHKQEQTTQKED